MSGADIKLVCDKASIFALNEQIRDGKKTFRIERPHFLKAIREVKEKNFSSRKPQKPPAKSPKRNV